MPARVLFVCMGNICRSPTGEGVLRTLVIERDLDDQVEVDSAGTIDYHTGSPADERMQRAAARRGHRLQSLARQVRRRDFEDFDLIVAMDRDNLHDLEALVPRDAHRAELRLLSSFLPAGAPTDVPDPYYGGDDGFERVLDLIEQAATNILDHLVEPPR